MGINENIGNFYSNGLNYTNFKGNFMEISLCCTLKNEKTTIKKFLDSILVQTLLPNEIIIVDGGSDDGTIEILNEYRKNYPQIKLIIEDCNISRGRNIGIKNSSYDYIVTADAGTIYDKNWLKNIFYQFEIHPEAEIVPGFWKPDAKNLFEDCQGRLLYPKEENLNWDNFLPSCRSLAFKKRVWEEIGGYNENLPGGVGEDTLFGIMAKKNGYKFAYAKNAICFWQPRTGWKKLFKQYYSYSKGSAVGSFSMTHNFRSYGSNPFTLTFNNLIELLKDKKFSCFILSFPILVTVFLGKVLGTIAGKIIK